MINYDKLLIVAYDFDDTLFAHFNHKTETEEEEVNYIANSLAWELGRYKAVDKTINAVFGLGSLSQDLKSFIRKCKSDNLFQGLISGTCASVCADAKIDFAKANYGIHLKNWCVNSQEKKIQMLKALALVYNCKYENILIIDDNYKVVTIAADAGFQSATPIEVVNYMQSLEG